MFKKLSNRSKVYCFLGLCALLIIGGLVVNNLVNATAAAADAKAAEKKEQKDKDVVPVELAQASRGEIATFVTATTNLRAQREVDVASQAEGVVRQLMVEEGAQVNAGDVLCVLDDTHLQIRLQSSRQKLAQANLQLEKAQIQHEKSAVQIANTKEDLARYEELFQNQLVSEREVAQIRYRLEELEHDTRVSASQSRELAHRVSELEAEQEQVTLEISRTRIRAPFSGVIVQRTAELGRTVRTMEALFKLSAFSPLYADVYLSEAESRQIQPGQSGTIRLGAEGTALVPGKVVRVSPVVDQTSGTVKVTVEQGRPEAGFKPGAFVLVGIQTTRQTNALLIPKRAVLDEDGEKYVFVARDGVVHRKTIRLGSEMDGQVEVRQGLTEKQQVVVAGQGALKEGAKIKIIQVKGKSGQDRLARTTRDDVSS